MKTTQAKSRLFFQIIPFFILVVFGTIYLYGFMRYIFFYQEKSSLYLTTFSYLLDNLSQPGGFLVYLGEIQTSLYFYPLLGAVLVTLEVCGIIYLISKIAQKLSGRMFYLLPFLIGAALFFLLTIYQFSAVNILGILSQVALLLVSVSYLKSKFQCVAVLLFPVSYYLFGSFSLIFIGSYSIILVQNKEWIKLSIAWLLTLIFFFAGKEFLFFQTTETLLQYPLSNNDVGGQVKLFFPLLAFVILIPIWSHIAFDKLYEISIKSFRIAEISPFVVLVILVILVIPRIDKKNSHYFHVEKLFYEQKYDELIEFNKQFPSTNILSSFLNNIALNETGRLSNSFLSFPQTSDGKTLFLKWEIISEILKRGGYYYYSLGMVNEAQRWAYEYMVMRGNTPETVKMIIKTELINGNYESARKYISILRNSLFYKDEAFKFEKLLFDEAAINAHPELGEKRRLKPKDDFFVISDVPEANLDLIIASDSTNTKALEYKLAMLLLQKDMKGVVEMLPLLENAGYTKIPKNVEEAVVTYKLLKVGELPKLEKLSINPQTEQRFQQYYTIFQQNQQNKQRAKRALARDFSDTYWYYVFFN